MSGPFFFESDRQIFGTYWSTNDAIFQDSTVKAKLVVVMWTSSVIVVERLAAQLWPPFLLHLVAEVRLSSHA